MKSADVDDSVPITATLQRTQGAFGRLRRISKPSHPTSKALTRDVRHANACKLRSFG
jgi:hypothetical protein